MNNRTWEAVSDSGDELQRLGSGRCLGVKWDYDGGKDKSGVVFVQGR